MPNQFLSDEFGDIEDYFVTDYRLIDNFVGDTLWVWGYNNNGQLGVNDTNTRTTPVTTFAGGTTWKQISCGNNHTAAIKTDGTLWTWGSSAQGQLGLNDTNTRTTPVTTFAGGTNWKQISCGSNHTAAIKTDGSLWVWGWNNFGGLGINVSGGDRKTPVTTFAGGTNWKSVDGGKRGHTVAIKTDGTLWGWGFNDFGQLGTNDAIDRSTPVTTFAGGTNWKSVAGGYSHTAAIKTDGSLWSWGKNDFGQLGNFTTTTRSTPVTTFAGGTNWKSVVSGTSGTLAIKTDGTLWNWGRNEGRLGANDGTSLKNTPVTTFAGGTNWKSIASGTQSAAIKTDGTLWTWGVNPSGQLGTNDTTERQTPVTTFAGGNNWKQVSGTSQTTAIKYSPDP